ncbi:hypothetical protein [Armatimonas sp.]|uniref:hypothetical protein n=1 Tax=Armatimonas sp. TaxID=1872638 RepID=UPI00374FF281
MASGVSWTTIKKELILLNQEETLNLLKDIYDASASNKAFLQARVLRGEISLADFEERIRVAFYSRSKHGPTNGYPKLRDGKAVLSEFKKARPGDLQNYLDLQLHYIETGTQFTNDFGDITDSFYSSLLSVMGDVAKVLEKPENQTLYSHFLPRLKQLYSDGDGFGWGYTDELHSYLESIAEAHGDTSIFPKRRYG